MLGEKDATSKKPSEFSEKTSRHQPTYASEVANFFDEMALADPAMASERDLDVTEWLLRRENGLEIYAPKSTGMSMVALSTSVNVCYGCAIVLRCLLCISGSCVRRGCNG